MASYIAQYYNEIDSGRISANIWIKGMYKQLIPILDGKDDKYFVDLKRGHRAIQFIERFCKQTKGIWAGKPLELMLFQKAKLEAVFGVIDRDSDLRRFKQVFDLRARKNGKTTENAGTALYLLGPDKEGGAEIYSAATIRSQAALCWDEAKNMIARSKDLQELFRAKTNEIICDMLKGFFKPLGKNTSNFDGLNAHGIILDEVHALDREIYDILWQSTTSRLQWLINMITTAGTKREGLFDDLHKSMMKIALGQEQNEEFLPILYQLDKDDDFRDESVWIKSNPGLGVIKSYNALRSNVKQIEIDPGSEATVKVKDFNILGVRNHGWLTFDQLNNERTFDMKAFKDNLVIVGIDLSKSIDMTAVNFSAWDNVAEEWVNHQMYWITEEFYQANKDGGVPYRRWVEQGHMRISGVHNIIYQDISNYILTFFENTECRIGWIYYDSYSAVYLIEELKSMGFHDCIPTWQGYKTLSIPMQTLGAEFKDKKVNYNNNPVTKWCLSNTEVEMDANLNIKPRKYQNKRSLKIDGTAVLLNSFVGILEHLDNMKNYRKEV